MCTHTLKTCIRLTILQVINDTHVIPGDIVVFVAVVVFDVTSLPFMRYAEYRPLQASIGSQARNLHPTFEQSLCVVGCGVVGCINSNTRKILSRSKHRHHVMGRTWMKPGRRTAAHIARSKRLAHV